MYKLLYYTQYDGAWTLPDSNLRTIWNRMVQEKADKKIFYSGEIRDSEGFLAYFKSPRNFPFFVFRGEQFNIDNVDAFVWCTNIRAHCGMLHFCVFRPGYGRGRELSDCVLKYIYGLRDKNGERIIKSVRGETPKFNKLAVKYLRVIGMKIIGEVPYMAYNVYTKEVSPMVISYQSIDDFKGDI